MTDINSPLKPVAQQGKDAANAAADKFQSGIQSTQQAASKAMDKASDKVDEIKRDAAPMLDLSRRSTAELSNGELKIAIPSFRACSNSGACHPHGI